MLCVLSILKKKYHLIVQGTAYKLSNWRKICIKIGDIVFDTVEAAKRFCGCLHWLVHIDSLCKKMLQKMGILSCLQTL